MELESVVASGAIDPWIHAAEGDLEKALDMLRVDLEAHVSS